MTNEKILINYLHEINYLNDPLNAIGATTSTTLRSASIGGLGTSNLVRKFGVQYLITDVTNLSNPGVANLTWYWMALNGTVMGSRANGGAFFDGGTVASQGCYLVASASGGAATLPATMTVTTNFDPGGRVISLPQETVANGAALVLFVSDTGSTYYDSDMRYGGARHTPQAGLAGVIERKPYFTISSAIAALGGAVKNIVVMDSEIYDEEISTGATLNYLSANTGCAPTLTCGIGARVTREVVHDGNNVDTAYVSKTGVDAAGGGTWAAPYLTIQYAFTNRGARTYMDIMDSGIGYSGTISAAMTIEPIYGMIPTACFVIDTVATTSIYGFITSVYINIDNYSGNVSDCTTISAAIFGIWAMQRINGSTFSRILFNNWNIGFYDDEGLHSAGSTITFSKCIFSGINGTGINIENPNTTANYTITNCIFNKCGTGIYIYQRVNGVFTGTIENCTFYKNTYGIILDSTAGCTYTAITRDLINYGNTTSDFYSTLLTPSFSRTNYLLKTGWIEGVNCILTDPKFSQTSFLPYMLGLRPDSGAYKTDTSTSDMGAQLAVVTLGANSQTVNGFIIDGQSQYNNGISQAATRTGCIIKWCTLKNFQGIAIDNYATANTTTQILNCFVMDNGCGLRLAYGANTIDESIFSGNASFGVWADWTVNSFTNCVFYGNDYGLNLAVNSAGVTYRNNISNGNFTYGIYSVVALVATYSCINDAINSLVDIMDASNIEADPYLVDVDADDYHIKTIEGGAMIDSLCKDAASDGGDIGAYIMDRSISSEAWRKYQLAWNPLKMDPEYNGKGVVSFENALGGASMFEKGHKRVFPFQWSAEQASTGELWKKIQFLSSLVPDRDQGRTADQCRMRLHLLPTQFLASGAAGTVDATAKTITDVALALTEDELKGWHVGVKFTFGTGMVVDAVAKTATKAAAGWTVDQWAGYYFYYLGYYYIILSNSATVLTLADPNATLTSTTTAYSIDKYFKILKNEPTILYLQDDDGELLTGPYGYYVDFIEVKSVSPKFKTSQERYFHQQETWKNGFELILEET